MILKAMGGLGNRLQAILSYRTVYPDLIVDWGDLPQVGGEFLDVFEPLSGVTFIKGPDARVPHEGGPTLDGGERVLDNFPHRDAPPTTWYEHYRDLQLIPELRAKVLGFKAETALHVRRTDHAPHMKAQNIYTPDGHFLMWASDKPSPVYLATDNGTTQREFIQYLGGLGKDVATYESIREHADQDRHDHRNTTLAHAAIDLFSCARAEHFMGTRGSSFSATISLIHRLGGWWS